MHQPPSRRTIPIQRVARAIVAAVLLTTFPALVAAHPLGNFTINHYAEVRVEPDRVALDVVIDHAEIPAFQERRAIDTDRDGVVSAAEVGAGRAGACARLSGELELRVDGERQPVRAVEAGLSFPAGVGGLATMRLVCGFEAPLATSIGERPVEIRFRDGSFADRIGWREIVAQGSGVEIAVLEGEPRATGVSERLTRYPEDLLATPLDERSITLHAVAGGPQLAPLDIPDAEPLDAAGAPPPDPGPGASPDPVANPAPGTIDGGAVPGGIDAGELPDIFRSADLTPIVLLVSLLTAAALGAGHALTPGHGKTLMAAYLVGTRGTPVHALGLGLSVSLSHTLGILLLAALVTGAAGVLPPEVLLQVAPLVAAVSILAIGAWMLATELRRRRGAAPSDHDHDHGHDHGHEHDHPRGHGHDHGHDHDHPHGTSLSWRSLFALGLAGGIIPSTSALLILLGSIAAGRPAFGLVLVIAFGLGMAAVMTTIGVVLVLARGRLDRLPSGGGLGRLRQAVPLAAAGVVLAFGIALTVQALSGALTL